MNKHIESVMYKQGFTLATPQPYYETQLQLNTLLSTEGIGVGEIIADILNDMMYETGYKFHYNGKSHIFLNTFDVISQIPTTTFELNGIQRSEQDPTISLRPSIINEHTIKTEFCMTIGYSSLEDIIKSLPMPRTNATHKPGYNIESHNMVTNYEGGPHIRFYLDPKDSIWNIAIREYARKNTDAIITSLKENFGPTITVHNSLLS